MTELTAQDLLGLRAIRDHAFRRNTPHEPLTLDGLELHKYHLYSLQERGLIALDHVLRPALTTDGRTALDMSEISR